MRRFLNVCLLTVICTKATSSNRVKDESVVYNDDLEADSKLRICKTLLNAMFIFPNFDSVLIELILEPCQLNCKTSKPLHQGTSFYNNIIQNEIYIALFKQDKNFFFIMK